MLRWVIAGVRRWEALSRRAEWRWGGVGLGLVLGALVLALPTPAGLTVQGQQTAAVALVMAVWWVGSVLPMALTATLPLFAFPAIGLGGPGEIASAWAHPLNVLMAGGFVIAVGMERAGVHERLTALVLAPSWVRATPERVLLALMCTCAALSGLVSNTATTVMMLPLATLLASRCSDDLRTRGAFVLGLAYSASIGGVSTPVGTPPNAVFAGMAADRGVDVGFVEWLCIGAPFVVVALPVAWLVVSRVALPAQQARAVSAPPVPAWRPGERPVLGLVALALAAWLTRKPLGPEGLTVGGWGAGLPATGLELDALVALGVGALVFLVPGPREEGQRTLLVPWRAVETGVPWSVLVLLGGGFALARGIQQSGLTEWLASGADALAGVPTPAAALGIATVMTFTTEITSNTASTQIALPLLEAAAERAGASPLSWMVPATIAASCAFMMPVATAPNAIAVEAGGVSPADMATSGLILNLLLAPVVVVVTLVAVPWVLGG